MAKEKEKKEQTKGKDNKNFLLLYAIIIAIILVLIMFVLPDDIFMLKYKNMEIPVPENTQEKKEFIDYEEQKQKLLNNNYDYAYVVLDSMGTKTYQYVCEGKIRDNLETGTCSEPNTFSYTEKDKKNLFKIDTKYLEFPGIIELIKDVTPEEVKYVTLREYHYNNIMIDDLETEIIIYTDVDNITKIELSNKYMTYILKYSNVSNE